MATETTTKIPPLDLLSDLLAKAKRAGADAADAVTSEGVALSVTQRLGKREDLERSEGQDIGLRVFVGKQQAIVSTSDNSNAAMNEIVERAVAMAKAAPEDPYCGLADPGQLAATVAELDLLDPHEPDGEELYAAAAAAEDAARAVKGVTNSDGAGASWSRSERALVTSDGFAGSYVTSGFDCYASVIAGKGTDMETDYAMTRARFGADLEAPEDVGKEAGERTVRRLNPRKVASMEVPVVFEPRISNSVLRNLTMAISGPAVARGTSFLRKDMGNRIFADGITIIDDYAHHPVEISAVLKAARTATERHVIAVMQPHRYSRLRDLFDDFCTCFNDADEVIIADVYAAGEEPIQGIDRDAMIEGLRAHGHSSVRALEKPEGLAAIINDIAESGDLVVCLGAGNITAWANALPEQLTALRKHANSEKGANA